MDTVPVTGAPDPSYAAGTEAKSSAVSWAAIAAGAVVALSVALLLVTLGAGLGLASLSPWQNSGPSVTTFGIATGIGLIVVHWISSASGGYITGRLRTKWVGVHTHEVFFRDTAHGFVTWAVATLIGAIFLASAVSSVVSGGVHAGATVAGGATQGAGQAAAKATSGISAYDVDSLFRSDHADAASNPQTSNAQASRILATGLTGGDISADDRSYLVQMVSARTGISQDDAKKRVDDVIAREKAGVVKAKQEADAARKAAAEFAIFTALAMLIGAFVASAAAALGGGLRDEHP
jgi:hypothetical protein